MVSSLRQALPTSEEQAQDWREAFNFAEEHPNDVSYPWIDPATGVMELSAASALGVDLLTQEASTFATIVTVRSVTRSFSAVEAIKDGAIDLRDEGVSGAELIYMTAPDHESDRAVITVSAPDERLFEELARRYGTDAIAIQIDPSGAHGLPAGTRQANTNPYWGGGLIGVPTGGCTSGFPWIIGSTHGNAMLTAAHCIYAGGTVSINGTTVGSVTASSEENWIHGTGTTYYAGQTVYRGDAALIRLYSSYSSAPWIFRGDRWSSTGSPVVSVNRGPSSLYDRVYLSGENGGETGYYVVNSVGINFWYAGTGETVKNVSRAATGSTKCAMGGDSGGAIFSIVTGGVRAMGTMSGFASLDGCAIIYTDINVTYLGLPGDVLLQ